jgi:hypothetical protein
VSPSFGGTESQQTAKSIQQSTTGTGPLLENLYAHAHGLTNLLIRAWQTFDQRGGDWSRKDVQQDVSRLRKLLDGYAKSGNARGEKNTSEVTE